MKYNIGQPVKVIQKVEHWGLVCWVSEMDKTIGNIYTIIEFDDHKGYKLNTSYEYEDDWCFWYPEEALSFPNPQLMLFDL